MAIYDLPPVWDAKKFASRYGLNQFGNDFHVNSDGKLEVLPILPDNPPIFELPDPPPATITHDIQAINIIDPKVKAVLLRLAGGR